MIHEALLYLWNCPGDLFQTESEEGWMNSIEIENFLHPGEREQFQRIVSISLAYHEIEEFVRTVTNPQMQSKTSNGTINVRTGLYVKAFANGIDEVLDDYRKDIINLEETLLNNSQLALVFILGTIEKYVTQFDTIKTMIQLITVDQVHGCPLIGKLHLYSGSGIELVSKTTKKILQSVNTVFYRCLWNWIIYGDLLDNYDEFFIVDAHCADENFLYPDQLKETKTTRSENYSDMDFSKKHKIAKPCEVRKFYLNKDMVPSHVTMEMAETILFLGRVVWIIRNDPNKYSDDKFRLKFKRDIWDGKDIDSCKKLEALQDSSYDSFSLSDIVEDCRLQIAKYLWKVMVEEAKLIEHLQLIRDYYALGRGELFQQFIIVAEEHLKKNTNEYITTNLNQIFIDTARKLYTENDKSYLRFELTLSGAQGKSSSSNPWSRLGINFNVTWPLHIIFHPAAMGYYNKIFCFLLRIKKTHIDLHKTWLRHKKRKHKIDPKVWSLNNNLMFIINNLQYYFQVDVIEAHFSLLISAIQEANQFEDIIRLHSEFLQNLLHRTFVMAADGTEKCKHNLYQIPKMQQDKTDMVYATILEVLHLCDKFCMVAKSWTGELLDADVKRLEKLQSESETLIELFLKILSSLHQKSSDGHLLQLLYYIDFNRWFSNTIGNLNISTS